MCVSVRWQQKRKSSDGRFAVSGGFGVGFYFFFAFRSSLFLLVYGLGQITCCGLKKNCLIVSNVVTGISSEYLYYQVRVTFSETLCVVLPPVAVWERVGSGN